MRTYMVGEHMIKHPLVTTVDETVESAFQMMRENDIRHLPVVKDQALVGIVSERDLKAARNLDHAELLSVGDVMREDLYVVTRATPISEVASDMAEGKVGSAMIVGRNGEIEGIFTTTDALLILASLLEDRTLDDCLEAFDDYRDGARYIADL